MPEPFARRRHLLARAERASRAGSAVATLFPFVVAAGHLFAGRE